MTTAPTGVGGDVAPPIGAPQPGAASTPPVRHFDRSIIEGPLGRAVWHLAWPTMLVNIIGGVQGLVDHILVGRLVGYAGNAAVGASWQIFLVIVAFVSSLFIGMSVLVARYAGAGDREMVNRTVYQAFITALGLSLGIFAPIGYLAAPTLLALVRAAPEVQVQALPYLRILFVFASGMMIFFMLGGALRSAGDAKTPMRLGVALTILNVTFNVVLIRGLGPVPALGTRGAAIGMCTAYALIACFALVQLRRGVWVVSFPRGMSLAPDWEIIRALFRFGIPSGIQGVAMNIGGALMLAFIGSLTYSAAAQAAYAVSYTQLFSLVTWTSVGLMGAAATVAGQNLGAGQPDRSAAGVHSAARIGIAAAAIVGLLFLLIPQPLLGLFGMHEPEVVRLGVQLMRVLSVSGFFITVALTYTGGLQGTGDTRGPLYISIISQVFVPLGICFAKSQLGTLHAMDIWLAILAGHATRCALSVLRFRQGKWRKIVVDVRGRRA